MIAVDTNILVYAHRVEAPLHTAARRSLAGLIDTGRPWIVPMHCLVEFYGHVTNRRIYLIPTPPAIALSFVTELMRRPAVEIGYDVPVTWHHLHEILAQTPVTGPQAHDARIVAVCLSHGVTELWSADRGFSRFPQLKVFNPLA